jgi:hypothetical protein
MYHLPRILPSKAAKSFLAHLGLRREQGFENRFQLLSCFLRDDLAQVWQSSIFFVGQRLCLEITTRYEGRT